MRAPGLNAGVAGSVALLLAALAAAVAVAAVGGREIAVTVGGETLAAWSLTAASAALLLLIAGVGLVVQLFNRRYSVDDPERGRLALLLLGATAASAATAAAATLVGFAIGWLLTTAALLALLGHGPLRGAAAARRTAARGLLIGDAALAAAVAIVVAQAGNVAMADLGTAAATLGGSEIAGIPAIDAVAVLLVVAALGRCAQAPLGGWLMGTIAVPTPVSAQLHAGIVNAGGLLIVLAAPLATASGVAMALLFVLAAATVILGTSLMIARSDVKGSLALSTRGQMGFMLLQCAIGAFAAAIFHLIAHGMYKAALFLGSGTAIDAARRQALAPPSVLPPARGRAAVAEAMWALLLPAALLAGTTALLAPSLAADWGSLSLLAFAWASAAQAAWWWQRQRQPAGVSRALGAGALAAAIAAYVGALELAKSILGDALPAPASGVVPGWVLLLVLALAMMATGVRWWAEARPSRGREGSLLHSPLARRAYVAALTAEHWPLSRPRPRRRREAGAPAPALGGALELPR